MELNYLASFLIAFIPLIIAYFWYQPTGQLAQWSGQKLVDPRAITWKQALALLALSMALIFGYMHLIIHQLGFYELFFTDIMRGSKEAEVIAAEFLAQYGDKHRHFGHGAFHGAINAFVFPLPFIVCFAVLHQQTVRAVVYHFLYWLFTSILVGGLIAAFV